MIHEKILEVGDKVNEIIDKFHFLGRKCTLSEDEKNELERIIILLDKIPQDDGVNLLQYFTKLSNNLMNSYDEFKKLERILNDEESR